tara:strand:+ start:28829 stop:29113 length:285 start_codon:yes stop_codon:yes gene_type:complete
MHAILAAAVTKVASGPDVVAAGQVMAQLNDWRAILFVMIVMFAVLMAAFLAVVFFAFRSWMKQAEALGAIREAMVGTNVILARFESQIRMGDER